MRKHLLKCLLLLIVGLCAAWPRPAPAYIGGPPATLGMMCSWSTHVIQVKVEKIDREKGIIIWRKLKDYKGNWPGGDVVKQSLGTLQPADRENVLRWADVGKTTAMFALEGYKWSHTYIDNLWYASNTTDWQWWNVSHVEPIELRTYCGRTDRLQAAVGAILADKEVVVPAQAEAKPNDPNQRMPKVQRVRASLKLTDYNPKRDFVDWGGDDFEPLLGMPGFTRCSNIAGVGPDAQAISIADFDGDGKPDVCLIGAGRISLLQNSGDSLLEVGVPGLSGGCRAAVWADYNGDGKPDLLLATATGPKLFTNLGNGNFRDDSHLLPREPCYNLTAAAWIDFDGDGRPDILLGNGFHGLRLYRNLGAAVPREPQPGGPPAVTWLFEDVSARVGLGPNGLGSSDKGDTLTVADVEGDGRPDILYGARSGMLLLNTPSGFKEAGDCGISYKPGNVGPIFGDFDNSGALSLFVPQLDGPCKLFKNDGKGHFADVTAAAGDLSRSMGVATCAAWGDIDNRGRPDLIVGCLRSPNRFFRNNGDGTFTDATEEIGLHKRIFNTQAIGVVDLNHDGVLDLVFNNEGQDAVVLMGDSARPRARTPVVVGLAGTNGIIGSRVRILGRDDKVVALQEISGGDGRGGQAAPLAHFALEPGNYRVEARFSSGLICKREINVTRTALRLILSDR